MTRVPKERSTALRYDWPWWAPLFQSLALSLFHGAVPFALSRLSDRHGWSAGHPALWNCLGLLPVAGGIALIVWTIGLHREGATRSGWRFEKTPFEPAHYLIVRGPYRYSRNPIYLSHLAIWSGWMLFYGSVALLVSVFLMWMMLAFVIVPYEERGLVRGLGEPYARYRSEVGRWFGRSAR